MEEKLYETLKKVFDLTHGAWDDPVISEELYNEMENVLIEYEKNIQTNGRKYRITNDITMTINDIKPDKL
jgi:hypothetical protein